MDSRGCALPHGVTAHRKADVAAVARAARACQCAQLAETNARGWCGADTGQERPHRARAETNQRLRRNRLVGDRIWARRPRRGSILIVLTAGVVSHSVGVVRSGSRAGEQSMSAREARLRVHLPNQPKPALASKALASAALASQALLHRSVRYAAEAARRGTRPEGTLPSA